MYLLVSMSRCQHSALARRASQEIRKPNFALGLSYPHLIVKIQLFEGICYQFYHRSSVEHGLGYLPRPLREQGGCIENSGQIWPASR